MSEPLKGIQPDLARKHNKSQEFISCDYEMLDLYWRISRKINSNNHRQYGQPKPYSNEELLPEINLALDNIGDILNSTSFELGFEVLNEALELSQSDAHLRGQLIDFTKGNYVLLDSFIQSVDRSKIIDRFSVGGKNESELSESSRIQDLSERSLQTLKLAKSLAYQFNNESKQPEPELADLGVKLLDNNFDVIQTGFLDEGESSYRLDYFFLMQAVMDLGKEVVDSGKVNTSLIAKIHLLDRIYHRSNNLVAHFELALQLFKGSYTSLPLPPNTAELVFGIFSKHGLKGEDLLNRWGKSGRDVGESKLNISFNIQSLIKLEEEAPGITKWLGEIGVTNFKDYLYTNLLVDEFNLYKQTGISFKDEREYLQALGMDFDNVFSIWIRNHPTFLEKMDQTISRMKYLEEQRPGICKYLYKEYDIVNFSRYPGELLIKQFDERDIKNQPYGVLLFPLDDYNGAFYQDGPIIDSLSKQIKDTHSLKIIEASSKTQAVELLCMLRRKHGRADFGILGGHGSIDSIHLGSGEGYTEAVFTDDNLIVSADISKEFPKDNDRKVTAESIFRYVFNTNPTIILFSCSTGMPDGIAQKMSRLGAHVIGPDMPASPKKITVNLGENNRLSFFVEYKDRAKSKNYFASQEYIK